MSQLPKRPIKSTPEQRAEWHAAAQPGKRGGASKQVLLIVLDDLETALGELAALRRRDELVAERMGESPPPLMPVQEQLNERPCNCADLSDDRQCRRHGVGAIP